MGWTGMPRITYKTYSVSVEAFVPFVAVSDGAKLLIIVTTAWDSLSPVLESGLIKDGLPKF